MYLRSIHQIGLIFLCLNYFSSYLAPRNSIDTKTDNIFESSCTWFDNSSILWSLLAFGNFLLILSNCCRLLPTLLSISDLLNFLRWTFDSFNPVVLSRWIQTWLPISIRCSLNSIILSPYIERGDIPVSGFDWFERNHTVRLQSDHWWIYLW